MTLMTSINSNSSCHKVFNKTNTQLFYMNLRYSMRAHESILSENSADYDHRITKNGREFLLRVVFGSGGYPVVGRSSKEELFNQLYNRDLLIGDIESPEATQRGQRVAYEILEESHIPEQKLEDVISHFVASGI